MHFKIILITLISIGLYAYDIETEASKVGVRSEKYIEAFKDLNITVDYSNKNLKEIIQTYEQKKPRIEQMSKHFVLNKNGAVSYSELARKDLNKDSEKSNSKIEGRIYIFMSASVPKETWRGYAKTIDALNLNDNVVMVMRGCIGGCEKIKPTLNFIQDILVEDKNKGGYKARVAIDPLLFRLYKIKEAPTVVYAKGLKVENPDMSEGLERNIVTKPKIYKSTGDWSLRYHLDQLYKISNEPALKKIIDRFNDSSFHKRGR